MSERVREKEQERENVSCLLAIEREGGIKPGEPAIPGIHLQPIQG